MLLQGLQQFLNRYVGSREELLTARDQLVQRLGVFRLLQRRRRRRWRRRKCERLRKSNEVDGDISDHRRVAFSLAAGIAFFESYWKLIADDPDVWEWSERFIEAGGRRGARLREGADCSTWTV
jgi:hypothetical protein